MKLFHTATALTLTTLLLASTGCARWTLFPKSILPNQQNPTSGTTSLLEAVGLKRGSTPAASQTTGVKQQTASSDLKDLDPALSIARLTERQGDPDDAIIHKIKYR